MICILLNYSLLAAM